MRLLINELIRFIKSDFNKWLYPFFFVFLFISVYFNYEYGFYWKLLVFKVSPVEKVLRFFIFLALPWFVIAIPKLVLSKRYDVLKNPGFYLSILLILLIISVDAASVIYKPLLDLAGSFDEQRYLTKIFCNFQGVFTFLTTWGIFIFFNKNIRSADLGLNIKKVNLKPFYLLIIFIIPIVTWASFNADFASAYPSYKPWDFPVVFNLPKPLLAGLYELVYGFDFINLEFMYRGLLVILMARYFGKDAVLPMAATYCFLHFGKPEAEAISSIFGGYFLGVVALNSRSIAPGVILHLSLAYMMDLAAYLQHYLR